MQEYYTRRICCRIHNLCARCMSTVHVRVRVYCWVLLRMTGAYTDVCVCECVIFREHVSRFRASLWSYPRVRMGRSPWVASVCRKGRFDRIRGYAWVGLRGWLRCAARVASVCPHVVDFFYLWCCAGDEYCTTRQFSLYGRISYFVKYEFRGKWVQQCFWRAYSVSPKENWECF